MKFTVVGLFESQEKANDVSKSLEKTGIKNGDYIIYKTNNSRRGEKQVFWQKILGFSAPHALANDKLITCVAVYSDKEMSDVKATFAKNGVVKTYEFQDMTIDEAKDLDYIRKIVEVRAKSHIYAMPRISVSNSTINEGMTAEVIA